jgi:hypothetical protein
MWWLVEWGVVATNLYPPLSVWLGGVVGERYEGAWEIWRRIVNLPLKGAHDRWAQRGGERGEEEAEGLRVAEVVGEVFREYI